jgi:hypothetical protein
MSPKDFRAWMDRVFAGNRSAAARALSRDRITLWRWETGTIRIPETVVATMKTIEEERRAGA